MHAEGDNLEILVFSGVICKPSVRYAYTESWLLDTHQQTLRGCKIKSYVHTKATWDLVAERIEQVADDIILHAQNRTGNLRVVNALCLLKAKTHRSTTASLVYSCAAKPSHHTLLWLLAQSGEWVHCRRGFIPGQGSRFPWINN